MSAREASWVVVWWSSVVQLKRGRKLQSYRDTSTERVKATSAPDPYGASQLQLALANSNVHTSHHGTLDPSSGVHMKGFSTARQSECVR